MTIPWSDFVAIIRSHRKFLLTSHVRPDCDALGSELGMAEVLESLGKDVLVVNGQPTPPNLAFIDPKQRIRLLGEDVTREELEDADVLIILDTSAWAQLGPMGEVVRRTSAKKVVLDHHVGEDDLGATYFKDMRAEATGRLVVQAAEQLGVALTPAIATPVFAAVATDTGWFRFPSAHSDTYRLAAQLIDAGAVPHAVYEQLYEQDTLGRVRLRGLVLERIAAEKEGRLAHTYILREDFDRTGSLPSDTEDLINMALEITGVEVAVILIEQPRGGFKTSLRSKGGLDCCQLASQFGGGGHKAAAGAFLNEPFEQAQEKVLHAVRAAMD